VRQSSPPATEAETALTVQANAGNDIANVQALRAVAALTVAIGHGARAGTLPPAILEALSWFAYAGVDVFFVISGFIVSMAARRAGTRATREGRVAPAFDFAARRFFRIFPLYWVALAVAITFGGWLHIAPPGWPDPSLLAMATLRTMWVTPLSPAWTLAFEVYFYTVLTGLILLAGRHVYPAIAVWMVLQAIWIFWPGPTAFTSEIGTNPLVFEFALGWLVALVAGRGEWRGVWPSAVLALAFMAGGTWLTAHRGLLEPLPRLATFGIGSAFALYAVLGLDLAGWCAPRWLRRVGDASYSIYLWHLIVFGALYAAFPTAGPALFLTAVAVLVTWAFVSFAVIERPAKQWGARVGRWRPRLARSGPSLT
jgi:peptidoglycan/LPS O-acetylase OafA/YrhL